MSDCLALARVALTTEWLTAEHAALAAEWRDAARLELVNGRRAVAAQAHPLAVVTRRELALRYRGRAAEARRLLTASTVWDDRELVALVLFGRRYLSAALATETDERRRAVLEIALSILEHDAQGPTVELPALEDDNAPAEPECAHHRHRRRRAGPCLQRPHLVHARQGDDPYPPRAESSQACGANSPRLSSNPGGSR